MKVRAKRMGITIVVGIAIAYLILCGLVYFLQDRMLYYPQKEIEGTPKDIGLDFEEVLLKTRDGVTIHAWYIPAKNERGFLLFCHGNAGNISHRLDSIQIFNRLGLSVLILDYRGYGRSEGKPSEEGTYLDAEAAWDYLVNERKNPANMIVIFGRSLGGAVAAEMARRHACGALIIESGFTSVPDFGQRLFPYLPVRLLAKYKYATIDKIVNIATPKLFIHSPDDEIIPFYYGKALYDKAAKPKEFLQIRGGHNEGFLISSEKYADGIDRFLTAYLDNKKP
jgi:fermentation-respiration switch protein FrsA (DUF1100 family)